MVSVPKSCFCVSIFIGSGLNALNDFIEHFEGLSYGTHSVQAAHSRTRRSVHDKSLNVDFKAFDRDFNLRLRPSRSVFSENAVIERSDGKSFPLDTSHIFEGYVSGWFRVLALKMQRDLVLL